jgi:predicted DNA-binding ribbon-helix-helix protein
MAESRLIMRTVRHNGACTSVKLEPDFWEMFDRICIKEQKTIGVMVNEIDSMRDGSLRASAIRVFILRYLQSMAASRMQVEN